MTRHRLCVLGGILAVFLGLEALTESRVYAHSGWHWPLRGRITQGFIAGQHYGIDIAVPIGTAVKASKPGRVTIAGWQTGYGNVIYLDHGSGWTSRYAHLNSFNVRVGAQVGHEQVIARSGNTGKSTGPHLHFEIRRNGVAVNPLNYLP